VFSLTDVVTAVEEEEERGGAKNHFSPEQSSPDEPLMEDPEWSDFVMSHFTPNELDPQGCPKVHGLRRVSRKLLGPVLYSGANVVKATEFVPGLENVGQLQPVTVEYTLKILMVRECPTGMDGYEVTYKDVADAYFANTDPDFLRHAAATCATKSESRCYRKALMLNKVSADELTRVPAADAALNGLITPTQINFLKILCARNNVNLLKFVNAGEKQYRSVTDVSYGTAAKMVEHLNKLQNTGTVPEALQGYDKDWEKK
jgi:hypothetical protein